MLGNKVNFKKAKTPSKKYLCYPRIDVAVGGESGIRTHDTIARIHTFQACALNRSAISPINTIIPYYQ